MKRLLIALLLIAASALTQSQKWPEEKANDWYARQPWLVGSNYIPAYAVNQLEMWQADTFDLDRINLEFIWAENLGMNTMRVFLHDLLWKQDPSGFRSRINKFLGVAKRHHIRPIFVLLDSCWDPFPEMFHQRPPQPGIHNSRWVQSPGANALADPKQELRILEYVQNVILAFADDDRILAWDVWNEPDNLNQSSYGKVEDPNKLQHVTALLPKVFQYARSGRPTQPLTSGLWHGDWSSPEKLSAIEKIQVEQSDFISFHNYGKPEEFTKRVEELQQFKRPIFCTEIGRLNCCSSSTRFVNSSGIRVLPGIPRQPGLGLARHQPPVVGRHAVLLGDRQNPLERAAVGPRHVLRAEDRALELLQLLDALRELFRLAVVVERNEIRLLDLDLLDRAQLFGRGPVA